MREARWVGEENGFARAHPENHWNMFLSCHAYTFLVILIDLCALARTSCLIDRAAHPSRKAPAVVFERSCFKAGRGGPMMRCSVDVARALCKIGQVRSNDGLECSTRR